MKSQGPANRRYCTVADLVLLPRALSAPCRHLVKGTPLVESYGPPAEPFEPSGTATAESTGRRRRRFRFRLPLLLRPTSYPFSRPVSLLVIFFLPIALPLTVGYLITRFALQGRESRRRIRDARKERGEGREGFLMRVGVKMGEIAEQVGGDNPEYAADLDTNEIGERQQPSGGAATPSSASSSSSPAALSNDGESRASTPRSSAVSNGDTTRRSGVDGPRSLAGQTRKSLYGATDATSSAPESRTCASDSPSSAVRAAAGGVPSTQVAPPPSEVVLAEARRLRTDPKLSASQQFQVENLNAIPQLRKHFVYLPHARNAHGAIVRRDPTIAVHREGKKVIDAWVRGFEV